MRRPQRPFRTRPRVVVLALTVLAVLVGSGVWALTRTSSAAAPTYTLISATVGTVRETVSAAGTIEPARQANLSFAVSGTVRSVSASVGKRVRAGDVLATVGTATLQSAVDTAAAGVTAAEDQLSATATANGSVAQRSAASAQLAAAKANLATSQDNLAQARLTSPISGTVATVSVAVGDRVSGSSANAGGGSGSGGSSGTSGSGSASAGATQTTTASGAQVVVISTDAYVVNAEVQSADLARLRKGLQAQITPTGSTTPVFGTVAAIGIVASTGSTGGATFPVVISLTGTPTGLYAGGTADVAIIVRQIPDALTVPTLALHTVGDATVVYQRKAGNRVTTPVRVGASYGATTQILSGLAAGDSVEVTFGRPAGTGARTGRARTGTGTGTGTGGGTGGGGFFGGGGTGATGGG